MTHAPEVKDSFVLVRIGDRRCAVAANLVAEMSPPVRLHKFPHTTEMITGVIVRRGRIVPVCDAHAILGERKSFASVFYLITECKSAGTNELLAIAVNGESELVSGELQTAKTTEPGYISGTLLVGTDSVPVLNLTVLAGVLSTPNESRSEAHS